MNAASGAYDAIVNKPWLPGTRAAWNAGMYGEALGGIAPEFLGVFGIAKSLGTKLTKAVAKKSLMEAEAAAIRAGKISDDLADKAKKAGITEEELTAAKKNAAENAKAKDGESILGNKKAESQNAQAKFLAEKNTLREGMLKDKISPQKQARHLKDTAPPDKSYLSSMKDAQQVLDATRNGQAKIISVDPIKNSVVVQYQNVIGTYINRGGAVGLPDIIKDTNLFMIQGGNKVVPVNPSKGF